MQKEFPEISVEMYTEMLLENTLEQLNSISDIKTRKEVLKDVQKVDMEELQLVRRNKTIDNIKRRSMENFTIQAQKRIIENMDVSRFPSSEQIDQYIKTKRTSENLLRESLDSEQKQQSETNLFES